MRRKLAVGLAFALMTCNALAADYSTKTGVNLRSGPSKEYGVVSTLPSDFAVTMLAYDAEGWSRISVGSREGFIRSDLLKITENTADNTNASAAAQHGNAGSYKTTAGVNFRAEPGTAAAVLERIGSGTAVKVSAHNVDGWSSVSFHGKNGYISSQYLTLISLDETAPAPSAPSGGLNAETIAVTDNSEAPTTVTDTGESPSAPDAPAETAEEATKSCRTTARVNLRGGASTGDSVLSVLAAGTQVTIIGEANGWSQVSHNGKTGYIKSDYLRETTQSGTLSSGGVEYLSWSSVKSSGVLPLNVPLQITDVRTGMVYFVQSFSNGSHADVEPVTAADTSLLKQTYGGSWSWSPRPVWITVNGRSYVGSINGMPHGGGVISGNNMDGQVCLHLPGSSTHNGNNSFGAQHAAATEEAWKAAS